MADHQALNADLHCHSTASDGVLEPGALAMRAHENGVQLWSLTDHDTLAGQQQAASAAADVGLAYVNGVEISVLFAGRTIHVVGLRFDAADSDLNALLDANRALRDTRAHEMARRLELEGFTRVFEGALQTAGSAVNLARPHFARYLVDSNQAPSAQYVFEHYLGEGKRCFVPTEWIPMKEAISVLRRAGGDAVLAHPLAYGLQGWGVEALIQSFKDDGGVSIEVVSGSRMNETDVAEMAELASAFQLTGSRGSDFHLPIEGVGDLGKVPFLPKQVPPVWGSWK